MSAIAPSPKSAIAYSPLKDDLFFPCKNAQFFMRGVPASDAALCAEMVRLAYCRSDQDFTLSQAKTKAELGRVGFKVAGFFESSGTPKGEGTHCFLALRQDKKLAVVSFRGTDKDDPTDVADDIDAIPVAWEKGGKVHQGFKTALAAVRDDLTKALDALKPLNARLLIAGHSLGAALATLLAGITTPSALYTFGSPLVGDADFVATLQNVDNHRYVDCCDIVTRIPPEDLGYRHLGKPYYIAQDRSITFDPGDGFILKDRAAASLEYPFKYQAWKEGNVGLRELADHAPVNYVTAVMG
ncbi:MAG TPA: lipase family protein [Candidatus Angelobacter sp.]